MKFFSKTEISYKEKDHHKISEDQILKRLAWSLISDMDIEDLKKIISFKVLDPRYAPTRFLTNEELAHFEALKRMNFIEYTAEIDIPENTKP